MLAIRASFARNEALFLQQRVGLAWALGRVAGLQRPLQTSGSRDMAGLRDDNGDLICFQIAVRKSLSRGFSVTCLKYLCSRLREMLGFGNLNTSLSTP